MSKQDKDQLQKRKKKWGILRLSSRQVYGINLEDEFVVNLYSVRRWHQQNPPAELYQKHHRKKRAWSLNWILSIMNDEVSVIADLNGDKSTSRIRHNLFV